jgi:hypothetical protein
MSLCSHNRIKSYAKRKELEDLTLFIFSEISSEMEETKGPNA